MLTPEDERRRLLSTAGDGVSDAASLEVVAHAEDSSLLLRRCREVLDVVLNFGDDDWPELERWSAQLPQWFVEACASEEMPEESEQWLNWWRSLSPEQQIEVEEAQPWALSEWLEWLRPSERTWYWLGAAVMDSQTLLIWLDTPGSPSPTGALVWLLKAAGAREVVVD